MRFDEKYLVTAETFCSAAPAGPLEVLEAGLAHSPRWSVEGPREPCTDDKPYTTWPVFAQCDNRAAAEFIAHARVALPEAIAEIRRLQLAFCSLAEKWCERSSDGINRYLFADAAADVLKILYGE